jgi:hypothetical protein
MTTHLGELLQLEMRDADACEIEQRLAEFEASLEARAQAVA